MYLWNWVKNELYDIWAVSCKPNDLSFLDNSKLLKYVKHCSYKKKVLDLHYRQRRNKSKKAEGREEAMGFSAMDETLIKSRCLWICNNFNLHYITHYYDINLRNGKNIKSIYR